MTRLHNLERIILFEMGKPKLFYTCAIPTLNKLNFSSISDFLTQIYILFECNKDEENN